MEEVYYGLLISKTDYGENDRIVRIYTPEKGVLTATFKGVKRAGAKLKFASEPFCFAEYRFAERAGKRTVTGATLIDSFYPVRADLVRFYAGSVALEFIKSFSREGISSPVQFFLTVELFKRLAYGENTPRAHLCAYLLQSLKNVGYAINTGGCLICGKEISERVRFDADAGGFYCNGCTNLGREINLSTYLALKKAENDEKITEEEGTFGLRLMNYYITLKTDEKLNSLTELLNLPSAN